MKTDLIFDMSRKLEMHIALACGLPGLFLGTYGDTTIEYMHVSSQMGGWRRAGPLCVVIKSNHWLRGIMLSGDMQVSALVSLNADPVFELLKRHRYFPARNGVSDARHLMVNFLFKGGYRHHFVDAPAQAKAPTPQLYDACLSMIDMIKTASDNAAAIVSSAQKYDDLPGNSTEQRFGGFATRHFRMTKFGQSGLFEQPDAPHDTEYMLQVDNHEQTIYLVIMKTRRFFRVSGYKKLLDFDAPDVDWKALLQAAHQPKLRRGDKNVLTVILSTKEDDLTAHFKIPQAGEDAPALWHILNDYIMQLRDT